ASDPAVEKGSRIHPRSRRDRARPREEGSTAPRVRRRRASACRDGAVRGLPRFDQRHRRGALEAHRVGEHLRPRDPRRARARPSRKVEEEKEELRLAKKRLAAVVRIQIPGGQATPAPPVGTALGPHGINIMDFCKAYNAATENKRGSIIPA